MPCLGFDKLVNTSNSSSLSDADSFMDFVVFSSTITDWGLAFGLLLSVVSLLLLSELLSKLKS